jgi:cytochrome c oxidase subunit 2
VMTSRDVIHSFFVPEFRVKMDVVPGRYTMVWFEAKTPGTYPILCTEYCGTEHSLMRGEVVVLTASEYARWLRGIRGPQIAGVVYREPRESEPQAPSEPIELVEQGERIAAREGCLRCHTTDGSPHIGPSFAGLYGTLVTLQDGSVTRADEAYLTASMMDPREHLHAGFPPVMPSYRGRLDPGETAALVELIRSLEGVERWDTPAQAPSPEPFEHYPEPEAPGLPAYPKAPGVAGVQR